MSFDKARNYTVSTLIRNKSTTCFKGTVLSEPEPQTEELVRSVV